MAKAKHDWVKLDPAIDQRKAQGWNDTQIAKDLGIGRQTLVDHLRSRAPDTPMAHPSTPVHPGTLEEYQQVMEEVHQSVPDAPHIGTDEVYPSTPEVHPELSPNDSSMVHSGVPARQERATSIPMVHPGTPSAEDWELWNTIKARWLEVEKMLADRQAMLSTPMGTPGNTQKKTYVFDVHHVSLIDRYAQDHRLDLKEVLYQALEEFFQRRSYTQE